MDLNEMKWKNVDRIYVCQEMETSGRLLETRL